MKPGNTPKRRATGEAKRELRALIDRLDRPTAGAVVTILEIVRDVDRQRASRLLEAVAMLLAVAPSSARRARS